MSQLLMPAAALRTKALLSHPLQLPTTVDSLRLHAPTDPTPAPQQDVRQHPLSHPLLIANNPLNTTSSARPNLPNACVAARTISPLSHSSQSSATHSTRLHPHVLTTQPSDRIATHKIIHFLTVIANNIRAASSARPNDPKLPPHRNAPKHSTPSSLANTNNPSTASSYAPQLTHRLRRSITHKASTFSSPASANNIIPASSARPNSPNASAALLRT